jgi:hypothetical protein
VDNERSNRLVLRRYTEADIPLMVDETELFCKTHPFYRRLPFQRDKLEFILNNNITNMLFCCFLVADVDNVIAGMAATIAQYAIADRSYSEDIFFFVKPEYRNGRALDMLLEGYISWAHDRKVFDVRASYTGGKSDIAMDKIMSKHGMDRFGTLYAKIIGDQ